MSKLITVESKPIKFQIWDTVRWRSDIGCAASGEYTVARGRLCAACVPLSVPALANMQAGQEKYHSLAPMYYRGAAAAIVVYDITQASSFV
jgi:hypothetical protein